jgi:ATP-binding cassette subfamily B protein
MKKKGPNIYAVLAPYRGLIILLVLFTLLANGLNLLVPKIIANSIDAYTKHTFVMSPLLIEFSLVTVLVFVFTYLQNYVQTYTSEKVAKDLRTRLADKISRQDYSFVQTTNPAVLLTNLTSDVDAVKSFVAQAFPNMIGSLFLIIGSSILLFITNWALALAVLTIIPIIGVTFFLILRKVRVLFRRTQEVIDWLNKVINESILGAALIRVLNSETEEQKKFTKANATAQDIALKIVNYFAALIPVVTFVASLATLTILVFGGYLVIHGSMTIGSIAAFNSYVAILIFPIILIGIMSNFVARAGASYERITKVLTAAEPEKNGTISAALKGNIGVDNVTLQFGEKYALKDISLDIAAGKRTAIIGPTAAGKTQLLYVINGLTKPTTGKITFDGKPIADYDQESLRHQMGFVFQDSVIFNMSLRENIAFNEQVTEADLQKAIQTAELEDFVAKQPKELDTIVSERGQSLSGGQKQRIMLARALAINPKILLLDDFTARVDIQTERKILGNVKKQYPDITLVSVTQKIASVEDYDQIIMLMEGEVVAKGTHKQLLKTSPEYAQLYESQKSTSHYEENHEV